MRRLGETLTKPGGSPDGSPSQAADSARFTGDGFPGPDPACLHLLGIYTGHMQHRHLSVQGYTVAAIDDVIDRGGRQDWAELRRAAQGDPLILARILRVCAPRAADPYAQRHHLWRHYAVRHSA